MIAPIWNQFLVFTTAMLSVLYTAPSLAVLYGLFGVIAVLIFLMTPKNAFFLLTIYLGYEGVFKVFSNYSPALHVGVDILIIILFLRSVLDATVSRTWHLYSTPINTLFAVHVIWFLISMFNPNSLGLIPSLSGGKMYISTLLVFFIAYRNLDSKKAIRDFLVIWCAISVAHVLLSIYQVSIGPQSVTTLHPRYGVILQKFQNEAFRPFGFTHLSGGPSVFVYLTAPFFMMGLFHSRAFFTRVLVTLYLPMAAFTLILCQGRAAILKSIFGASIVAFSSLFSRTERGRPTVLRNAVILSTVIALLIYGISGVVPTESSNDIGRAYSRSVTAFDMDIMNQARRGAFDRFKEYVRIAPMGTGIGRVGAAAGKFVDLAERDALLGNSFFSDNYWIAVFLDLGLPGLIIFTILIFSVMLRSFRSYFRLNDPELKLMTLGILSALASMLIGMNSADAVIYNPEGFFFWSFAGVLFQIFRLDRDEGGRRI